MFEQFVAPGVAAAASCPRRTTSQTVAQTAALPRNALAIALALLAAGAHAQSTVPDTPLPPVVVSATGYAQPLSQALPSVSVITREQIEQSGAQNLTTLLQQVAGVQVTSNGGPGQSGNVYLRGFGGTDVLVLLDGVPINAQDSTGVAYLNNFTTDEIERVEIIRGNVSAIYGSGAIGGVVLITTRGGSKTPQASVGVTAGSRGTYTTSANASGVVGNTATDQWQYDFTTSTFQNIASSRTRGVEFSGRGAWNGWGYDANLTLQQPVNTSLPGDPTLQRRARSMANVTLNREIGAVLLGAAVHYSGARWDNGPSGRVTLGGYTTVDLTASGAITPQWSWNARLQNLFDKKYQTVYGYNREPFGVFVGVTWRPAL